MCATIAQTEANGKCHLSALYLLVEFVLLNEPILFCQGMLSHTILSLRKVWVTFQAQGFVFY